MKKYLTALILICLLLTACSDSTESPEASFDLFPLEKLPENTTFSREVRKDYLELFADYIDYRTDKNAVCYVWTVDNELKFGMGKNTNPSHSEEIKASLTPATLGEMRALLSVKFPLESRKSLTVHPLEDRLSDCESVIGDMLGIGENCIEFTVCVGSYTFDSSVCGDMANTLYECLHSARTKENQSSLGEFAEYKGEKLPITVAFAPTGTNNFGGISDYGTFYIRPDGYMSYTKAMYSSTSENYLLDAEFYDKISQTAITSVEKKGREYPFVAEGELFCTVRAGIHSPQKTVIGEKVSKLHAEAKKLSESVAQAPEGFTPAGDSATAIYVIFYKDMEYVSEFVVYADEYCATLTSLSGSVRANGVLPSGSYEAFLRLVTQGE
jgi:hypothetical protein